MKIKLTALLLSLLFCTTTYASSTGVSIYSGSLNIGAFGVYSDSSDIEVYAGMTNSEISSVQTNLQIIGAQYLSKFDIKEGTDFVMGGFYQTLSGKSNGIDIDSGSSFGLVVGIHHEIGDGVTLKAQYHPYVNTNIKYANSQEQKLDFIGNSVQLGIGYLL